MRRVLLIYEVGMEERFRLLLFVGKLQLQSGEGIILPTALLLCEYVHALADGAHDGGGYLGVL